MKFELKFAKNGWILEYEVDGEMEKWVMNEGEDEVGAFANMLHIVTEQLGPSTGRYSRKRIYINCFPGDKNEEDWTDEQKEEVRWLYSRSGGK